MIPVAYDKSNSFSVQMVTENVFTGKGLLMCDFAITLFTKK